MRLIVSLPLWFRISLYGLIPFIFLAAVSLAGLAVFTAFTAILPRVQSLEYGFGFLFGGLGVGMWLKFWLNHRERIRQILIG